MAPDQVDLESLRSKERSKKRSKASRRCAFPRKAGATAGHSNATVKCILGGSSHFFCKWVLTLVKNGISGGNVHL